MVGNLGAKAGAEQFTEPKLAAAKDVMKSAIKRLHGMHKKAEQGRDGLSTNDDDVDAGQGERSSNPFPAETHDGNDAAHLCFHCDRGRKRKEKPEY